MPTKVTTTAEARRKIREEEQNAKRQRQQMQPKPPKPATPARDPWARGTKTGGWGTNR